VIVVSVCSLKGGVGKTSVALGLASAALNRGVPTLVVDLDPQADATMGLDVLERPAATVADVITAPRRIALDTAVARSGWADGGGTLDVMAGTWDAAALDSPRVGERAVHRLGVALSRVEGYRLILIDCPPSFGALTRTGLVASHRALVVSEPALFSVTAADRALRSIDELRRGSAPGLQPLGVLVNRYRDRSPEHRYRLAELQSMFGPLVLAPALAERSALQQAQGASSPLHRWPGAAADELAEAFDAHLARLLRVAAGGAPPAGRPGRRSSRRPGRRRRPARRATWRGCPRPRARPGRRRSRRRPGRPARDRSPRPPTCTRRRSHRRSSG
jgi:chromosome partitioning protein